MYNKKNLIENVLKIKAALGFKNRSHRAEKLPNVVPWVSLLLLQAQKSLFSARLEPTYSSSFSDLVFRRQEFSSEPSVNESI